MPTGSCSTTRRRVRKRWRSGSPRPRRTPSRPSSGCWPSRVCCSSRPPTRRVISLAPPIRPRTRSVSPPPNSRTLRPNSVKGSPCHRDRRQDPHRVPQHRRQGPWGDHSARCRARWYWWGGDPWRAVSSILGGVKAIRELRTGAAEAGRPRSRRTRRSPRPPRKPPRPRRTWQPPTTPSPPPPPVPAPLQRPQAQRPRRRRSGRASSWAVTGSTPAPGRRRPSGGAGH